MGHAVAHLAPTVPGTRRSKRGSAIAPTTLGWAQPPSAQQPHVRLRALAGSIVRVCPAPRVPPAGGQPRPLCHRAGRLRETSHHTTRDMALVVRALFSQSGLFFFFFLPSLLTVSHLAAGSRRWEPSAGSAVPSASEWRDAARPQHPALHTASAPCAYVPAAGTICGLGTGDVSTGIGPGPGLTRGRTDTSQDVPKKPTPGGFILANISAAEPGPRTLLCPRDPKERLSIAPRAPSHWQPIRDRTQHGLCFPRAEHCATTR